MKQYKQNHKLLLKKKTQSSSFEQKSCNKNTFLGLSCETCMDGYYRPTGVLPSDPGPCKACSCSGVFSTGQCLKTADPVYYPGMVGSVLL